MGKNLARGEWTVRVYFGVSAEDYPEALSAAVLRECGRRGYTGAVLDFEGEPRADLRAFAGRLGRRARETGRRLYVPLEYADAAPEAVSLICTAISGGNFREYLREEVERRGGGERVALDVQRLRMDFQLPSPDGEGKPLDAEAFRELAEGKTVYFSPDLCARYFTYTKYRAARDGHAQSGEPHFVLFDDADTLNRKLKTGSDLGIGTAFIQWPEARDIAADLRPDGIS